MGISETLRTLYSATVEQRDGEYYISVPAREIETDTLSAGETYRVALLTSTTSQQSDRAGPPVGPGDRRDVEIESIGEQGDGIAKIDRGYVVIVPDTEVGEYVTVEIDQAQPNVAFATVVDRNLCRM